MVVLECFYEIVETFIAVPPIAVDSPIHGFVAEALAEQFDGLFVFGVFVEVDSHLIVGKGDLVAQLVLEGLVMGLESAVCGFELAEGLLVLLLDAVEVGAEDQEFGVMRAHLQGFPDFEAALRVVFADEVVLTLLVEFLDLRNDDLHE
jgi:hypothetical protein